MGWAVGENNGRDIGYGVPAICDHPDCNERIDRGLAYVCGGEPPASDSRGCQRFFCYRHLLMTPRLGQLCERCYPRRKAPFEPKPDVMEWNLHKLNDDSWAAWRSDNAEAVETLKALVRAVRAAV